MNTRLAPSVERNICCERSSKQRRKSSKSQNLQLANQKTQTEKQQAKKKIEQITKLTACQPENTNGGCFKQRDLVS